MDGPGLMGFDLTFKKSIQVSTFMTPLVESYAILITLLV